MQSHREQEEKSETERERGEKKEDEELFEGNLEKGGEEEEEEDRMRRGFWGLPYSFSGLEDLLSNPDLFPVAWMNTHMTPMMSINIRLYLFNYFYLFILYECIYLFIICFYSDFFNYKKKS